MKKLVLIISVLLLPALIFAQATPEKVTTEGPVELTFWSPFTGGDGKFFDAMVEEFNRSQDEIVMKPDTVKFDNYYTKLTTSLAAKSAPDVVVCHQDRLLNYAKSGAFLALDDYVNFANDFQQGPLQACRIDGKLYSLPLDVHPIVLYYNTEILKQAGIEDVPETAQQFLDAAAQVKANTGKWGLLIDNTTGVYKAYTLFRLFYSMILQQDSTFLNADNTACGFDRQAGINALNWLKASVEDGTNPSGLDYDAAMNMFKLNEGALYFNGVWATGSLEETEGLTFRAAPIPAIFGDTPWSWGGSHTLAVPVQAKDRAHYEAAVTFIDWMTAHGELWAKAGHIPTRKSVVLKDEFKALPYRAGYADAAAYVVACPAIPAWSEINGTCSDLLEEAITDNIESGAAIDNMVKVVNDIIAKY